MVYSAAAHKNMSFLAKKYVKGSAWRLVEAFEKLRLAFFIGKPRKFIYYFHHHKLEVY